MDLHFMVLSYKKNDSIRMSIPLEDKNYTDSHRIEPNSRSTLIGEQPNPSRFIRWEDVLSRHRGVKLQGQYELSPAINLLSLA